MVGKTHVPATARVIWIGRSQAVRLPRAFRFDARRVRIRRHGNAVILEPIAEDWSWLDKLRPFDDDVVQAANEQPPEQHRPELDEFYGIE